jgi:hypothetical protein
MNDDKINKLWADYVKLQTLIRMSDQMQRVSVWEAKTIINNRTIWVNLQLRLVQQMRRIRIEAIDLSDID